MVILQTHTYIECISLFIQQRWFSNFYIGIEVEDLFGFNIIFLLTGLQFRVQKYYEIHVASKHFNKYPCEHCDQVFNNKFLLTKHTESDHEDKLSRCELCGKSFAEDVHVKRHIYLVHTKRTPYECYHCSYKANKKSTLQVHMRKHTGEKPYQCDICQRCFSQSVDFRKHRANHFKSKAEEREVGLKESDLGYIIQTLDVTPALTDDERSSIRFETVHTDVHSE